MILLLVAIPLAGCGKKGPPLPPLPPLPAQPPAPRVRQVGDQLELLVTLPAVRLDGVPIETFAGLEILRRIQDVPLEGRSPQMNPGAPAGLPVYSLTVDELAALEPGGLWFFREPLVEVAGGDPDDAVSSVTYQVRYLLKGRRWSRPGAGGTIVTAAEVPAPALLSATVANDGVHLTWSGAGDGLETAIYRTTPGATPPFDPMTVVATGETTFVDPTAAVGRRYSYTIRGKWAEEEGARFSAAAGPVEILMEDRFPPAAPQEVQALERPGGVDIFWLPGDEFDLAGYRVWRRQAADTPWIMLTATPVTGSSFTDQEARPGATYTYAVTAEDGNTPANTSPRSEPVTVVIPVAPPAEEDAP